MKDMNWLPVALLVLAAALAVTGSGRVPPRKGNVGIDRLMRTGRAGIGRLLARVELEEAPEFVMGAMCYAPAAFPERAEYICPVCGGRTLYGSPHAHFIQRELDTMRRMTAALEGNGYFQAFLEEDLCAACHPGLEFPAVSLVLVYEEGDTVRTQANPDDLRMLNGLLRDGLAYTTDNDSRVALKNGLERLRTILGME